MCSIKVSFSIRTALLVAFFLSFFQDNRSKSKLFKINSGIQYVSVYPVAPCWWASQWFLRDFLLLTASHTTVHRYKQYALTSLLSCLRSYVAVLLPPKGRYLTMRLPGPRVCLLNFVQILLDFFLKCPLQIHSPGSIGWDCSFSHILNSSRACCS